jgi:predicted GNAT family N-acyltransferase
MKPVRVLILDWERARERARPVRYAVFVLEQGVPAELEWDDWDELSDHALVIGSDGETWGTARLLPDGHLGRMGVDKSHRREGVGRLLVSALLQRARERGMARLVLHAQTHARGFYEKMGFEKYGDEFEEAGIPHVAMRLSL